MKKESMGAQNAGAKYSLPLQENKETKTDGTLYTHLISPGVW